MTPYENIFIEQFKEWQSVMQAFNRASIKYYSAMWPINVLREDVQFLPYDITLMRYDEFCKFAMSCLEAGPYKDHAEFFMKMVEKNYQKYLEDHIIK